MDPLAFTKLRCDVTNVVRNADAVSGDVVLVSEDRTYLQAHKIVLVS